MLYKETEKKEIERVYAVFADYIRESPYLEWFWSDKMGYLLLKISTEKRYVEEEILVDTAEQLASVLFSEVSTDVLQMTENEHSEQTADPLELAEIKRRWHPYIDQLSEYAYLCDELLTGCKWANKVRIHLSNTSTETMEGIIKRMLKMKYSKDC